MKRHIASAVLLASLGAVAAAQAQGIDTLKKIKDTGVITEGVRESSGALAFTLGDGKYTGFHYDVCQHVLADIQKQLGVAKLDIKYQPVTSQNRIPLVQNGTVDLECGSTTNTATRQKDVSFAPTLDVEEVRFATKKASGIKGIADLNGKDHSDSFLLLESGRADAFVMDGQILAGLISKSKNPADYAIVGEVLSVEPIAIMYRKDDPAFRKAVDDSVRNMAKSGEAAKLYDKWFLQPIPPSNTKVGLPVSDATKAAWANPNDKPAEDYAEK